MEYLDKFINECEKYYVENINRGADYNIFEELLSTSNEVRHSSFLRGLLDPNGKHGMKSFFLDLFLDQLFKDGKTIGNLSKDDFQNYKNINAYCEVFIGNNDEDKDFSGRIDLLIEFTEAEKTKKAIIIENKIYAKDQPKQLERYYNYGIKQYKSKDNFILVYLTLNDFNDNDSYNSSKGEVDDNEIIKFSYSKEIKGWLSEVLGNRYKVFINSTVMNAIEQYYYIVEQLVPSNEGRFDVPFILKTKYPEITKDPEVMVCKRGDLRINFLKGLKAELMISLGNESVTEVCRIGKIVDFNNIKGDKHPKNLGLKVLIKNGDYLHIELQDWVRLAYGLFLPDSESQYFKMLKNKDFEYVNKWWILKEFIITNSIGVPFPFYDDKLNYTFLHKNDELVERFSRIIISIINELRELE